MSRTTQHSHTQSGWLVEKPNSWVVFGIEVGKHVGYTPEELVGYYKNLLRKIEQGTRGQKGPTLTVVHLELQIAMAGRFITHVRGRLGTETKYEPRAYAPITFSDLQGRRTEIIVWVKERTHYPGHTFWVQVGADEENLVACQSTL